jgi:hypothetical protein
MSTHSEEPVRELPENPDLAGQLKLAIDADDLEEVKRLMTHHPELHGASLDASKTPPLTWAAFGGASPSETRLAMAQWMIENGSDIHQGDDGPPGFAGRDAEGGGSANAVACPTGSWPSSCLNSPMNLARLMPLMNCIA